MTRIGPYRLHSIDTGGFRLDGGAMFGIIPRPLWERRITPDDRNRIPLRMRCLLLEGEGRLILIDAGVGHKYDDKFADIYGIDHESGTLDRSLNELGFDRTDVTDLILTHLHFDHCGGATIRDGERLVPAFSTAKVYVQRRHWEWAAHPNGREKGSFLKENLEPLESSGNLVLLDGPGELFPGVQLHLVDGHTEAQQLVEITGEDRSLLYCADLLPTHAHLPDVWVMAYDLRPLVTMEEKGRMLSWAHERHATLFFEHDPEVEIADIIPSRKGFDVANIRPLKEF